MQLNELGDTGEIEDITKEELMAFTHDESIVTICIPVDQDTAVAAAVDDALELLDSNARTLATTKPDPLSMLFKSRYLLTNEQRL